MRSLSASPLCNICRIDDPDSGAVHHALGACQHYLPLMHIHCILTALLVIVIHSYKESLTHTLLHVTKRMIQCNNGMY